MRTLYYFGLIRWTRTLCRLRGHRYARRPLGNYMLDFCSRCWTWELEPLDVAP